MQRWCVACPCNPPPAWTRAQADLIRVGLIAWQRPLYAVLSLDVPPSCAARKLSAEKSPPASASARGDRVGAVIDYETYCKIHDCHERRS
ncbi:MAG: hypothetical protein KF778_20820 [Rhodocyclaceae bacterium]|nr:hypothetical protein [Rhodocyclaceae bacterium]